MGVLTPYKKKKANLKIRSQNTNLHFHGQILCFFCCSLDINVCLVYDGRPSSLENQLGMTLSTYVLRLTFYVRNYFVNLYLETLQMHVLNTY